MESSFFSLLLSYLYPSEGNPSLTALPFLNPLPKFPFLNKVLYLRTFALPLSSL